MRRARLHPILNVRHRQVKVGSNGFGKGHVANRNSHLEYRWPQCKLEEADPSENRFEKGTQRLATLELRFHLESGWSPAVSEFHDSRGDVPKPKPLVAKKNHR